MHNKKCNRQTDARLQTCFTRAAMACYCETDDSDLRRVNSYLRHCSTRHYCVWGLKFALLVIKFNCGEIYIFVINVEQFESGITYFMNKVLRQRALWHTA